MTAKQVELLTLVLQDMRQHIAAHMALLTVAIEAGEEAFLEAEAKKLKPMRDEMRAVEAVLEPTIAKARMVIN